jgi:sulfoxide reductase heme-binding subunit YedZ
MKNLENRRDRIEGRALSSAFLIEKQRKGTSCPSILLVLRGDRIAWIKSNWRWIALNLFAASAMAVTLTRGSTDWAVAFTFDPMLESGKWAIRLLLICLTMSPLDIFFGWHSAIKLRKPAGLWSFGFAMVHFLYYISDTSHLLFQIEPFFVLGALGLIVLTALAITSNRWAMRRFGKYWKRLHRLVYFGGIAMVSHAILAASVSKKVLLRDPQGQNEIKIYLALLAVLLVVRIPLIRRALKRMATLLQPRSEVVPLPLPVANPGRVPEYLPKIYARDDVIHFNELLVGFQPTEDVKHQQAVVIMSRQKYREN